MLTRITRLARGAPAVESRPARSRRRATGFTLVEVIVALSVVSIGFLGAFAMVLQAGKLASAAEEEALVCSGLEQRMDQIRSLDWGPLTDGTGLTGTIWTARPATVAELALTQETMTISGYDLTTGQTLHGTWDSTSAPSVSFTSGAQALNTAGAVKVVATLTWTGRRSSRSQTRSLVTVVTRGGISKSVHP
jgi:prepilin-type N-terminal cleavage/methylation domain-containing protein